MKRRWWEDTFPGATSDVSISREQMQHVRDAFAFLDTRLAGHYPGTALSTRVSEASELLHRGDASEPEPEPEPEWRSDPPDSEGTWERRRTEFPHLTTTADVRLHQTTGAPCWSVQISQGEMASGPVRVFNHDGYEYRKIEGSGT